MSKHILLACLVLGLALGHVGASQNPKDATAAAVAQGKPRVLKTHHVPGGNAQTIAKAAHEIFGGDIKVTAVSNNQLVVWASAEQHAQIEAWVRPDTNIEVIQLTGNLKAARLADTLREMFRDKSLFLEADDARNALIVRGTSVQLAELKGALIVLKGPEAPASGTLRTFTVEHGSAATLAEAIADLLRGMKPHTVRVVVPGQPNPKPAPVPLPKPKDAAPKKIGIGKDGFGTFGGGTPEQMFDFLAKGRGYFLVTDTQRLREPLSDFLQGKGVTNGQVTRELFAAFNEQVIRKQLDGPAKKPEPKQPVTTLTAFGNRLIATSDDPQILALVADLVELFTRGCDGDLEVIRLRHATAVDAARVLEELFNGRPANAPGGFGKGGGARAERVRIVADPINNALLIKGTPLDQLTIRNLVRTSLDTAGTDVETPRRMTIFTLKHAKAADVAKVLRDIYRDLEKKLSFSADARTNSLVVRCDAALAPEIEALLKQLDAPDGAK